MESTAYPGCCEQLHQAGSPETREKKCKRISKKREVSLEGKTRENGRRQRPCGTRHSTHDSEMGSDAVASVKPPPLCEWQGRRVCGLSPNASAWLATTESTSISPHQSVSLATFSRVKYTVIGGYRYTEGSSAKLTQLTA